MSFMALYRDLAEPTLELLKTCDFDGCFHTGEWRLVIRMLDCAFVDLEERIPGNYHSAGAWLRSDELFPFSFVFCCEHLGLEPAAVRRMVKDWLNESVRADLKLAA